MITLSLFFSHTAESIKRIMNFLVTLVSDHDSSKFTQPCQCNLVKILTHIIKAGNYFEHAVCICFAAFLPLQPKPEGMQAYKSFIPTSIFIQTGPLELNIS